MSSGTRDRDGNNGGGQVGNNKQKRQKHGNNWHNGKMKMRPVTVETVRRIVAQEGRSARNLISWNAPLDNVERKHSVDDGEEFKPVKTRRRASGLKRRSKSCDTNDKKTDNSNNKSNGTTRTPRDIKTSGGSSRSSSVGKKQTSIRARYWAYLFENLRRAVDEIYATCETDQSVVECKEVLLVLDNYRHDFQALIDWINLQERINSTDVANRPTSLAWEVRKSSPGRPRQRMTPRSGQQPPFSGLTQNAPSSTTGITPTNSIKRCLKFPDGNAGLNATSNNTTNSALCESKTSSNSLLLRSNFDKKPGSTTGTVSWADKVKGVTNAVPKPIAPQSQNQPKTMAPQPNKKTGKENTVISKASGLKTSDEEEGWERVSSKNKQPKVNRVHFTKPKDKPQQPANTDTNKRKALSIIKDDNSNLVVVNENKELVKTDKLVAENLEFFVDSIAEDSPITPVSGNSSYSNLVVERSMATSSTSSYSDIVGDTAQSEKFDEDSSLNKVLFVGNDSFQDEDISLQTLEDVEAEYFKSDPTLLPVDGESNVIESLEEDSDSKTNKALLEHDASIAAAEQEEQELMKEIEEEENKYIDVDLEESNEADTPSASSNGKNSLENSQEGSDWNKIMARYEAEQEMHQGMTWGDMIDEEELREPGRAVQMHEKLSSPSRKRTPAESKRKMEEKQRSASLRRQKMVQDKTERIHVLTEKVIEVKNLKDDLISGRRELLQELHVEKLQRAEQQRAMKLMKIVQKAQAEETKVNEILFINELQEQNKRHDVLNRLQEHDARLQEIQQERNKQQEVKAAKEENVKERRRLLEKERQERLSELINKRKEQDSRIEQQKQEKEKEREKLARDKERERKIRLSALNAAQQEAVTELQKKIQIKHDESERRHQEQLEQRKEKALELSLGKFSLSSSGNLQPGELQSTIYEGEKAAQRANGVNSSLDLCLVSMEENETGKGDASAGTKNTQQDGSNAVMSPRGCTAAEEKRIAKEKEIQMRERKKAMRKRMKKLKTRMSSRGKEFLKTLDQKSSTTSSSKNKVYRLVKDINRQLANQKESSGPWPANRVSALDRALGEINRLLEKKDDGSKALFRTSGGFEMIEQVFEVPLNSATFQGQKGETVSIIPDKTIGNAASTFKSACEDCYDNVLYVLYSNRFTVLIDALAQQLTKHLPEVGSPSNAKSPTIGRKSSNNNNSNKGNNITRDDLFDLASSSLLDTLAFCIEFLATRPPVREDGKIRLSENKELQRALKMTITTSSRSGSMDVNDLDPKKATEGFLNRGLDVVSYIVSCGVLDKLSTYLGSITSEIEAHSKAGSFIGNGLSFLYSVTDFVALRNRVTSDANEGRSRRTSTSSNASAQSVDKISLENRNPPMHFDPQSWDSDPTQLLPTLYHTEVMGVVSVLYGILLHGAPERPILLRNNSIQALDDVTSPPQKKIPDHVLHIAKSVFSVLNAVADLDIQLLQKSLGAEGVSLEFRHICTYLLWYCQHDGEHEILLHEVIVCVGHFALCNKKNQDTIHSGAMPTVLQQLCVLPFSYFSNPRLSNILFPTLIACCHDNPTNLEMLEQEASSSLLSSYIKGLLEDHENLDSLEKIKYGGDVISKTKKAVALSSSRLYTLAFLRGALLFFDQPNSSKVITNGDVSSTTVSNFCTSD
ncbi:S phase cyclin A-associated protein in the endoplasmic reticulum-like isoform X1 [Styela clava]